MQPGKLLKDRLLSIPVLLPLLVAVITLLVDPQAYYAFHTPKKYALLVLAPLAWLFVIVWVWQREKSTSLIITVLEVLLLVRLVWVFSTNPGFAAHPSKLGFWLLAALMGVAVLGRQISSSGIRSIRRGGLVWLLRCVWMLGAVLAVVGLWQLWAYGDLLTPGYKTAMVGTIGSANGYGSFLAIGIVAGVADVLVLKRRRARMGCVLAIVLMLAALFLNGSRGAMLGLAGSCVVLGGLYLTWRSVIAGRLAKMAAVVFASICALCLSTYALYSLNPQSAMGRFMIWEISLPMLTEHPVSGIGKGEYATQYLDYQAIYFADPGNGHLAHKAANLKQAHNEYFQAFFEGGVIGGILFLSIWMLVLWRLGSFLWRRNSALQSSTRQMPYYGLAGILLVIMIHALVDAPLHVLPVATVAYVALGGRSRTA